LIFIFYFLTFSQVLVLPDRINHQLYDEKGTRAGEVNKKSCNLSSKTSSIWGTSLQDL